MREVVRDAAAQPVENLCINPSFERVVAGTSVVRRNLALNPSFERAIAGTTIVRRNLALNPSFESGSQANFSNIGNGGATIAIGVEYGRNGGMGMRRSRPESSGAMGGGWWTAPITVPGRYAVSFYVRVNTARSVTKYTEGTAPRAWAPGNSGTVSLAANQWTRISYMIDVSAPGTFKPGVIHNADAAGDWIDYDDCLIERVPAILPYFDGRTTNDRGITYEWTGTPDLSESVVKTSVIEVSRNLFADPRATDSSTSRWGTHNGTQTTIADNFAGTGSAVRWTRSSTAASRAIRMQVGTSMPVASATVSVRMTLRASIDMQVTLSARESTNATGSGDSPLGSAINLLAGVPQVVEASGPSFSGATASAGSGIVVVAVATSGVDTTGSTLDVSRVQIVAGALPAQYADGFLTYDADLSPAWTGAENASPSVLLAVPAADILQQASRLVYRSWRGVIAGGGELSVVVPNSFADLFAIPGGTAGRTFTVLARVHIPEAYTGTVRLGVRTNGGSTAEHSVTAPKTVGTHLLRLTYTASEGTANTAVRVWVSNGPSRVVLDDLLVVAGTYEGPYFDGDTVDDSGIAHSWESTPHGSASLARAGTVEVRRNLTLNPTPTGTTGWSAQFIGGTGGAMQMITDPTEGLSLGVVVTTAGSTQYRLAASQNNTAVAANASITVRARLWVHEAIAAANPTLRTEFNISSDAGSYWHPVNSAIVAGWNDLTLTFTVPAGSTNARFATLQFVATGNSTVPVGETTFRIRRLLTELAATVGEHFDGSTSPDADLTPAWVGTEGASQSVLLGVALADVVASGARRGIRSHAWKRRGAASIRVLPILSSVNTDNFASPGGDTGAVRLGMVPGRTYTAFAKVRLAAPLTGTVSGNSRRIVLFHRQAAGSAYTAQLSNQPPNAAGEHDVRLTFSLPSDTTEALLRLYGGVAAGGGDVWFDEFALIEGDYRGPYVDGDFRDAVWRGTPHASTSIGYPQLIALQAA